MSVARADKSVVFVGLFVFSLKWFQFPISLLFFAARQALFTLGFLLIHSRDIFSAHKAGQYLYIGQKYSGQGCQFITSTVLLVILLKSITDPQIEHCICPQVDGDQFADGDMGVGHPMLYRKCLFLFT